MKRTLALFTVLLAFAIFAMPTYAKDPGPPDPYVMPVKVVNDPFCIDFGQYGLVDAPRDGFYEFNSNTIGLPDGYRVVIEQVFSEIMVPSDTTSVIANIKVVSTISEGNFFIQTIPCLVTDQGTDQHGNKIMIISQLMKLYILPIGQGENKDIFIQLKVYSGNDVIHTLGNIVTCGYYDLVP